MAELLFKDESFQIIGVCMEIHKALGMGLKEINYKDAMEIDFIEKDIAFDREKRFEVKYKTSIIDTHLAQALSYLAVSGMKLAIVINFGERSLTWKRIVL